MSLLSRVPGLKIGHHRARLRSQSFARQRVCPSGFLAAKD